MGAENRFGAAHNKRSVMTPQTKSFLKHLIDHYSNYGVNTYRPYNDEKHLKYIAVANHLASMSNQDLKTLISDKYWNSYPLYVHYRGANTPANPKNYYSFISAAVKHLIFVSQKHRKFFTDHASGAFRVATINATLGRDKLKAAKKGLTSGDARVRKLAVSLLPVSDLKEIMKTEKRADVLNSISKRVGYLNMLHVEVNSRYRWNRSRAFANSEFNPDVTREIIATRRTGSQSFYEKDIFKNLVYNVDSESAAFYLDIFKDLCNNDASLKAAFLEKLTGKSNV
jgi:hypothetical protein